MRYKFYYKIIPVVRVIGKRKLGEEEVNRRERAGGGWGRREKRI